MAEIAEALPAIGRDELREKIERRDPFVLIETLSAEQFRHAHLPGAVHGPADRIAELASELVPDTETEVVTYCAGPACHAAARAARALTARGYTRVRYYPGGKKDWISAGLPVER